MTEKKTDYKSFKVVDEKEKPKTKVMPQIERWWTASEKDLPGAVYAQVSAIIKNDRSRLQDYNVFSRLYGNLPSGQWLASVNSTSSRNTNVAGNQRIAFNLVQSCTDALTSKLVKSKPQPYFLTSKGDSKVQRKAKKLNDYAKGLFYQNKAYMRGKIAFRDACVWGVGVIHVYSAHGRVQWERVMPYELFTDFLESHYGQESTKTLHRVKNIDRTTLIGMFPDKTKDIGSLSLSADIIQTTTKSVADTVTVIESWRLPSAPGLDDGVHCITAGGITLFVERYSRQSFPFAILRYSDQLHGFWGQGLAEQLMPIQVELNRCLISIQRSLFLGGTYKILVHAGSQVVDSHFDNRIGTIIKWTGEVAPQYVTPPIVQPEIYQQVLSLKAMGYEQSGVSQLSAASVKPAGLNSGKALRENVDIETDRFQAVGQAYEEFYLDLCRLSIEEARVLYSTLNDGTKEGKTGMPVSVPGRRFIETIDWEECDLEEDQYVLQCFPVSKLPSDPEGRLETIQELMAAGLVSPENGRRLLDFPDLENEENLANAQLDYLHQILDDITEGGKYTAPEPDDNLQQALKLGIEYLAVGKRDNLEESRIDLLRTFISQVNSLTMAAMPPPQPQPVAPANPTATPVSPLLPNVNQGAAAA